MNRLTSDQAHHPFEGDAMLSHEFDPEPLLPQYCTCGMPKDALVHRLHVRPGRQRPNWDRLFYLLSFAAVIALAGYFLLPVLTDVLDTAWAWVTNR